MRFHLALIPFLGLLLSLTAEAAPVCQKVGNEWFLKTEQGQIIGDKDTGYSLQETCRLSARTLAGNIVCGFNGRSYQGYNSDNGQAIGATALNASYDTIADCQRDYEIQPPNKFACGWAGLNYSLFNRETNQRLLSSNYGWSKVADCTNNALIHSSKSLICGYAGQGAAPTLLDHEGSIISSSFKNFDDCNGLIYLLKTSPIGAPALEQKIATQDLTKILDGFVNKNPDDKVGFPWKPCEVADHQYHLTKSKDGFLTPECSPDTLYSWGGFDKASWFKTNWADNKAWPGNLKRSLYTSTSAAGTFGYGSIPLRFKVRKGTKFKLMIDPGQFTCDEFVTSKALKASDLSSTIVVRVRTGGNSFMEFIVCSSEVIDSWSLLTTEHYDETVRDHKWMTTENYYYWESYSKSQSGKDDYINNTIDNGVAGYATDFSLASLHRRMSLLNTLTSLKLGQVSASASRQALKAEHFNTKRPIYFNPN